MSINENERDLNDELSLGLFDYLFDYKDEYFEKVKSLIENGADLNNVGEPYGEAPIFFAIKTGKLYLVKYLVENGADIDSVNGDYEIPEEFVENNYCKYKYEDYEYKEILNFLKEKKIKKEEEKTRMAREIYDILLSSLNESERESLLTWAIENGNAGIMRFVIKMGTDINSVSIRGKTPFHWAIYSGDFILVQIMIENGADISNIGPLDIAVRCGFHSIVQLLISSGCDINNPCGAHISPLSYAAEHGDFKMVYLLVKNGADVNARDTYGNTALSYAENNLYIVTSGIQKTFQVSQKHKKVVDFLTVIIEKGKE